MLPPALTLRAWIKDASHGLPAGCTDDRSAEPGSAEPGHRPVMAGLPALLGLASLAGAVALGGAIAVARRRGRGLRDALAASQWALANARVAQAERVGLMQDAGELVSDVVFCLDRAGQLVFVSPSAGVTLGHEPVDLIDAAAMAQADAGEEYGPHAVVRTVLRVQPNQETTIRLRHRDGMVIWVEARCRPAFSGPGSGAADPAGGRVIVFRDVTRRVVAEQRLAEAAERLASLTLTDPLTGLANRTSFLNTVGNLLATTTALAVLFIDLDRFKPFNDLYGHAIGDAILREVGFRLAAELAREPIVARLGADEFAAVLCSSDDDTRVAARARDILRVISDPVRIGDMTLDVSATIGIAVSPRDGDDATSLLRLADIAMAHGKQAGGHCYRFFERRMSEELALDTELKADLRGAIAAGEIVPYFQPLVRLSDSRVVGFEVLARWEHPIRGVLPPLRFLPLVEEIGLSAAVFATILSEACAAARFWPAEIRFSVNISPRELQDESLPDDVRTILQRWGVDGSRLEIEITEDALINDSRVARGVLDGLRAQGVTVALDDFGTGFSGIYHLRELPFDKVKIDKTFMTALDRDEDSARYVAAIIGLGRALGLELTAEGIEDPAAAQRLRELGCTYGQGYLFGRPMPAAEAGRLVTGGKLPMMAAE